MHIFSVKDVKHITASTILLTLRPNRPKDTLHFYPGQYAAIGIKRHGRPTAVRCFSIVSSPNNQDELQFAMRVHGGFTAAISELKEGDIVFVHGPFGNFVIDELYDRNVVMLAGGIGITPFMSMIREATESKSKVPISLLYSNATPNNIPFYDELRELERQNSNFRAAYFITSGSVEKLNGNRVLSGRIDGAKLEQLTAGQYSRFTFFICGPKSFIKSMRSMLNAHDVEAARIVTEEFTPASPLSDIIMPPKRSLTRWTYGFAGATMMIAVAFIMTVDLARVVPKIASAQQASDTKQTQNTTQPEPSSSDSSSSAPTAPSQDDSSSNTQTTPTQDNSSLNSSGSDNSIMPTQTYQQPITSVS